MDYEIHPLAELIPPMTEAEFGELKADIEENGQREPITIYQDTILDGRHRYRACTELGVEPEVRRYDGDEPASYVLSLNIMRRNLSAGQRAAVGVEFLPQLEEEAKKRQAATQLQGRKPGGEPIGPGPRSHTDKPNPHRAREDAGAKVGVSGATIDRTRRVKEQDPAAFERIKSGASTPRAESDRLSPGYRPAPTDGLDTKEDSSGRKQPATFYGKGDKWQESTEPLIRYLRGQKKRDFDFSHLNWKEAKKRVQLIDGLISDLEAARADLEPRSHKAKLSF